MASETGVGITLGLITLILLSVNSWTVLAVRSVIEGFTPMELKIEKLSQVEADETFKRTRSADNVEDYVKMLQALGVTSVGDTFKLGLTTVTIQPDESDDDQTPFEVEVLDGSVDDAEPEGISVRAAKRRFNAAAKVLGFSLSWKEPAGWLIARAVASKVEVTTPETAGQKSGSDTAAQSVPTENAPATPTVGAVQSVASMPATPTVVRRRR